RN
ncbi:hypothetical protein CFC21_071967, partial [Triticum aestivum]